ncbi:zinc finger protein ZFP2-like isoform X1 [Haliotis rufescens]|uniref:zinc finger protein ZFP2-like isoform X1 n=2 Tax=Haliotis rufescens TaxID=6454 RepID=UPI00201ECF8D|nr:zinc finger protein ZFP2-like isoform X1 [Haliotis rufescens]
MTVLECQRYGMVDSVDFKLEIKQEVQHVHDNMASTQTQTTDGTGRSSSSNDSMKDAGNIGQTKIGTARSPLQDRQAQVKDTPSTRQIFIVNRTNQITVSFQQSSVMGSSLPEEKTISRSPTDCARLPHNSLMAEKEITIKSEYLNNAKSEPITAEQASLCDKSDRLSSGDVLVSSDLAFQSETTMKCFPDNLHDVNTNQGENASFVVVLPSMEVTPFTELINKGKPSLREIKSGQLSFQLQEKKLSSTNVVVITPETIDPEINVSTARQMFSQIITSQTDQSDEPLLKKIKQKSSDDSKVIIIESLKPTHGILRCVFCGSKFAQIVRLRHHMKTHCERKPFLCGMCDHDYYFLKDLDDHFSQSHWKRVQYSCSVCKEYFRSEQKLATHLTNHHPTELLACGICGLKHDSDDNLLDHLQIHANKASVRCGVCLKVYTECTELESHLKLHFEQGQYVCTKCNKTFKTAVEISKHAELHFGVNPFPCEQCECRFRTKVDLQGHMARTHRESCLHICETCDRVFYRLQQLKNHMMVHNKYECHFCGNVYHRDEHLKTHMKTHVVMVQYL